MRTMEMELHCRIAEIDLTIRSYYVTAPILIATFIISRLGESPVAAGVSLALFATYFPIVAWLKHERKKFVKLLEATP